jgi:thymidylate synthase (FAD)
LKIIEPYVELMAYTQLPPGHDGKLGYVDPCNDMSRVIERAGRVSWKSEDKMEPGSASGFITRVVNIKKDESIAEHCSVTLLMVTDRLASHQLVRHRIGAYTQESTHYINYTKAEKGNEIAVMRPLGISVDSPAFQIWKETCEQAEKAYFNIISQGHKHYHARFVLPSCLKTEIAVTYNLRMWRHVIGQRIQPNNTPEIIWLMKLALPIIHGLCPEMFDDLRKQYAQNI